MDLHYLDDRVRVTAVRDANGRPISTVNRVEVTRPDGTRVDRDWDKHDMLVKADQLGIWSWRMYIREEGSTRILIGQFEVVPPKNSSEHGNTKSRLLAKLLRRR